MRLNRNTQRSTPSIPDAYQAYIARKRAGLIRNISEENRKAADEYMKTRWMRTPQLAAKTPDKVTPIVVLIVIAIMVITWPIPSVPFVVVVVFYFFLSPWLLIVAWGDPRSMLLLCLPGLIVLVYVGVWLLWLQ